ncbi:hypothetical protein K491DRAFT_663631 [Lophiostoma macrostomum CBS 122681]|uniref:Zn(2)-C6 fungal-type domain-containing protein n=1 Tax=Lophiostoma macrostomum CBS 122681 TaxID=1314788 RepID=A0A6A6T1V3_9PLEO|nr:hypothetical protein K491DRAFT_663631 [Lophiostoma macrostomum CBS 122681]
MVTRGEKRSAPDDDDKNDDEGPACQSCRKRKARCSRQQPCQQCIKLNVECMYDESRQRPGMRPGVVEALNQRLTSLEQMFIGQGLLLRPLLGEIGSRTSAAASGTDLNGQTRTLREELLGYANSNPTPKLHVAPASTSGLTSAHVPADNSSMNAGTQPLTAPALPPPEVVDRLVTLYFQQIHPWIPVLHISNFQQQLKDPIERGKLSTVLLAIVSVSLRLDNGDYRRTITDLKGRCLTYRHAVILRSMETFSVQNLQALVIVAFDIIGSGRGPSAWSVVGSMARTVEQLGLSVEERDDNSSDCATHALIRRISFLKSPRSWVEREERRRIFWMVFLMDRFCSVATGWNNSLTGADVQRRLPCEGALWEAARAVHTPFFGIAERSPSSQTAPDLTPSSERRPSNEEEVNNIGGFAFCIEATESLNLVTTFFLRQTVNFENANELQIWLLKFKELDLRLVRWRLFLPSRWNDARAPDSKGLMDPNLSLAHMTHNTAVIQLHQCIAYPSPHWKSSSIALPSSTSAETCVTAAAEIASIAQRFLEMVSGVVNPQFSFCLFVAGRVLLAHSVHHSTTLSSVFNTIATSLETIAKRWNGSELDSKDNLASRFASRLRKARSSAKADPSSQHNSLLDIQEPAYSDDLPSTVPGTRCGSALPEPSIPVPDIPQATAAQTPPTDFSPDSMSLAFPPMPYSLQQHHRDISLTESQLNAYMPSLAQEGQMLLPGQEFQELTNYFDAPFDEMLRVSTYVGELGVMQADV